MKSGFAAVLGRPNAGKSSLINTLVGEKVAIVSPKSQTTRNKINGILTGDGYQIVFTDTPGIHSSKNMLSEYMLKSIDTAAKDTDVVIIVIDGEKGVQAADLQMLEKYKKYPLIAVFNKIDITGFEKAYPELEKLQGIEGIKAVVPVSAKTGQNTDKLLEEVLKYLPEDIYYYPEDEYTDKDVRFIISEIVREKALLNLDEEIPHGIGVIVASFDDNGGHCNINAEIVCEKASHKPIIIGKGGATIKKIGTEARLDIEKLLGKKVRIELFVKVRENWRDSANYLNDIGYNKNKL